MFGNPQFGDMKVAQLKIPTIALTIAVLSVYRAAYSNELVVLTNNNSNTAMPNAGCGNASCEK